MGKLAQKIHEALDEQQTDPRVDSATVEPITDLGELEPLPPLDLTSAAPIYAAPLEPAPAPRRRRSDAGTKRGAKATANSAPADDPLLVAASVRETIMGIRKAAATKRDEAAKLLAAAEADARACEAMISAQPELVRRLLAVRDEEPGQ